jgi:Fe-S oxidoreductase
MARMKIEHLHHWHAKHGWTLKDRMVAHLPRYAPWAARLAPALNLLQGWGKGLLGFAAQRTLPAWRGDPFLASGAGRDDGDVVLFVDTFTNYHEPGNAHAALAVLTAAGAKVHVARAADGARPLCCGRTYLATGMVERARAEARRMVTALAPFARRGVPIVGLEPSCLFSLKDEFLALLPGEEAQVVAGQAMLFEEWIARESDAGRLRLALNPIEAKKALLHGHCHQKAFDAMPAVQKALGLVPGLAVETVESSCCGMAGTFGYEASHHEISMKMAESALLPKVREAAPGTIIVADGTSCRHQIADGAGRDALHVAQVLASALER